MFFFLYFELCGVCYILACLWYSFTSCICYAHREIMKNPMNFCYNGNSSVTLNRNEVTSEPIIESYHILITMSNLLQYLQKSLSPTDCDHSNRVTRYVPLINSPFLNPKKKYCQNPVVWIVMKSYRKRIALIEHQAFNPRFFSVFVCARGLTTLCLDMYVEIFSEPKASLLT